MKNLILFSILLCWACAKSVNDDAEMSVITKLIDDETKYAAAGDSVNWSECWSNTDQALFTITSADGVAQYKGWTAIKTAMKDVKPFELKLKRDDYHYTVGNDVAFVSFDQEDNWDGTEGQRSKETRTLRKTDGKWKIIDANVIAVSSFERKKQGSFHIVKENVPVGMKAGKMIMRSQSGLGGMVVAFNEVPAGGDMTPLFEGLPDNACPAPHWGYIVEGTIRIKYVDGKEETVKAGEVFYWPSGHVPFVEKDLKIIDFTPEADFNLLMAHLAKKMAAQKAK